MRAAPLEEWKPETLADSIPELQKRRSCAAAWAAFFPKGAFAAAVGGRIWLAGTCCGGAPVEGADGRERASATTFVAPGVCLKSAVNSAR